MRSTCKRTLLALGIAALVTPVAHATNGYFAHGYGTKNKGMAGAGVALPQDSLAAATNPAGMVWVGDRMDLGAAIFSPRRKATEHNTAAPTMLNPFAGGFVINGTYDSDSEYFLVPHFGRNWMLGADSSFGVVVYGNGGMNTDYPSPGPWPGGEATGVDLMQLFVAPTYSKKISDKASWGVAPILAMQFFEARGVGVFGNFSTDASNLTNKDHDISYGAGVRVGWQGEVSPGLTLGAAATSKIYMSEFDDYAGLFAESGGFDIPAQVTLGLTWNSTPRSSLSFDIQHIMYSQVDSVANSITNLRQCDAFTMFAGFPVAPTDAGCFGGSNGAGFHWDDMTIYKLGYQWQTSSDWTWRVGASYGEQPIDETTLNILAPGVQETHLTFGFTKAMGSDSELNFAAMYSPEKSVRNTNALGFPDDVELEMYQYEFEASWGWRF